MPTPKQTRFYYSKVFKAYRKLQWALNDAHNADVIQYEGYDGTSPCQALDECFNRIKITTEKQLAEAMRREIGEGN